MLIHKEPKKAASRLRKNGLMVVGQEPAIVEMRKLQPEPLQVRRPFPMPPVDEFNTGYLKEKKHDPL